MEVFEPAIQEQAEEKTVVVEDTPEQRTREKHRSEEEGARYGKPREVHQNHGQDIRSANLVDNYESFDTPTKDQKIEVGVSYLEKPHGCATCMTTVCTCVYEPVCKNEELCRTGTPVSQK